MFKGTFSFFGRKGTTKLKVKLMHAHVKYTISFLISSMFSCIFSFRSKNDEKTEDATDACRRKIHANLLHVSFGTIGISAYGMEEEGLIAAAVAGFLMLAVIVRRLRADAIRMRARRRRRWGVGP